LIYPATISLLLINILLRFL